MSAQPDGAKLKKYVYYTWEGFTESPSGEWVENLQILAAIDTYSEVQAYQILLKDHSYFADMGFDLRCVGVYEVDKK